MKLTDQKEYLSPDVLIYAIEVESGFSGSTGQLPSYEEDDDEIVLG